LITSCDECKTYIAIKPNSSMIVHQNETKPIPHFRETGWWWRSVSTNDASCALGFATPIEGPDIVSELLNLNLNNRVKLNMPELISDDWMQASCKALSCEQKSFYWEPLLSSKHSLSIHVTKKLIPCFPFGKQVCSRRKRMSVPR
jgi:hypothetical protein